VNSKVKSIAHHFFFTSRGLFINNSSRKANQSIPHTIVTLYGDCVKMWENFAPNFGHKRTACWIATTHRLTLPFSKANIRRKTWLSSPPTLRLCFPWLKIKLKGRKKIIYARGVDVYTNFSLVFWYRDLVTHSVLQMVWSVFDHRNIHEFLRQDCRTGSELVTLLRAFSYTDSPSRPNKTVDQ
jgi:hypothetical protein